MIDPVWIVVAVGYLVVGGLVLRWLSARHPDLGLSPDEGTLVRLLGWPVVLAFWLLLRGPDPPAGPEPTAEPRPAGEGGTAVAVSDLRPWGTVEVVGRRYEARTEGGFVRAGESVEIVGRAGLRGLRVRPVARADEQRPIS